MIVDELAAAAKTKADGRKIADARVGLEYACVLLEDGSCGLAYTFKDERDYDAVLNSAARLEGLPVEELIPWAAEANKFRAALGLAAVNAVLNAREPSRPYETGNMMDGLRLEEGEFFGMIGNFPPVLRRLSPMTKNIYVFELNPAKGSGFYAPEDMPKHLPKCSHVLITASAIINHTIDEILSLCGGNKKAVYLVGPSAPLWPEAFGGRGVTLIAGCVVTRPALIMPIISLCGGTRHIRPAVEQVMLKIENKRRQRPCIR
jgi:hypothetical protein